MVDLHVVISFRRAFVQIYTLSSHLEGPSCRFALVISFRRAFVQIYTLSSHLEGLRVDLHVVISFRRPSCRFTRCHLIQKGLRVDLHVVISFRRAFVVAIVWQLNLQLTMQLDVKVYHSVTKIRQKQLCIHIFYYAIR